MASVSKSEKDKQKLIQDKCQLLLGLMLKDDDNKYCVDCDAKGPRWASWNIGIFLCIRCAGIHRNLGVHISRVKSVNLDSWTPEQVTSLQQMGNSRARAVYEANLPDSFRRPQDDSSLEVFIRAKYETKKYIAREWVPPPQVKVSWDAEIEADIKRKKEAKRKAAAGIVELPAPVTVTKSPVTNGSVVTPTTQEKVSGSSSAHKPAPVTAPKPSQDLLGLDNDGDKTDIFNGFLSAPAVPLTTATPSPAAPQTSTSAGAATSSGILSLQAEQDSFFNQTSPAPPTSAGEKKPLDKDSILALYKSSPAQSTTPMYGMQGGMFANTTPTMANGVASPAYMASPSLVPGIMQQAPYMTPQGGMGVGPNPFLPSAPVGLGYAQLTGQMGGLSLGGMVPNATPVPSPSMQGMFAQSLAPGMPPVQQQQQPALFASPGYIPPGHTLSNNLWQ